MSFGVGLGDVLFLSKACFKIFIDIRQAPDELQPIRALIEGLTHALENLNDLIESNPTAGPNADNDRLKKSLNQQMTSCNGSLLKLRSMLEKAASINTGRKRDKFSISGLKFSLLEVKDLQNIRQELSLHLLGIDLLQHTINRAIFAAHAQSLRDRDRDAAKQQEETMRQLRKIHQGLIDSRKGTNIPLPDCNLQTGNSVVSAIAGELVGKGAQGQAEPTSNQGPVNQFQGGSASPANTNRSNSTERVLCPICMAAVNMKESAEHIKTHQKWEMERYFLGNIESRAR